MGDLTGDDPLAITVVAGRNAHDPIEGSRKEYQMSWNGSIPLPCTKSKGIRNKRNKKSPKALIAKAAKAAKRSMKPKFERHGGGQRDDTFAQFDR